jgi:hypothetical protein
VALQQSLQGTASLDQELKEQADKFKRMFLSTHVVPSLKLDDKELGFVKQLKELQEEHRVQLMWYEQLKASKKGAVEQLNSAREVKREASQVIADLEERIKFLDQDKLGLEFRQVKLEKEVETLKRNVGTATALHLLNQPSRSGFYADAKRSFQPASWTILHPPPRKVRPGT